MGGLHPSDLPKITNFFFCFALQITVMPAPDLNIIGIQTIWQAKKKIRNPPKIFYIFVIFVFICVCMYFIYLCSIIILYTFYNIFLSFFSDDIKTDSSIKNYLDHLGMCTVEQLGK